MKKISKYLLVFIALFFFGSIYSYASTFSAYVAGNTVYIRSVPNTSGSKLATLDYGDNLTLNDLTLYDGDGCPDKWYKVTYNTTTGYMCSTYVAIANEIIPDNVEPTNEYETYLKSIGFPSSYWPGLTSLHNMHPNWVFNPNLLKVNWGAALSAESVDHVSLTAGDVGYRATGSESYNFLTDQFISKELEWYNASSDYIAYYMDPRNWLNEMYIFQFEDLSYHPTYQTIDVVKSIFTTDSNPNSDLKSYSQNYIDAANQTIDGTSYSISPVHLASRTRLEVGLTNGRTQINGTSTSTYRGFLLTGYYNFFNIGSYQDSYTSSPVTRGLAYASGTRCPGCGFSDTYNRPWDSAAKAISGGAQNIIKNYFLNGKHTVYYQRFNVYSTNEWTNPSLFTYQYMTQVESPASEASITSNAYKNNNKLGEAIVFNIPVYLGMPTTQVAKPNKGNPNNHLNSLVVNDKSVDNFAHDTFQYDVALAKGVTSINVNGTVINANATITGTGSVSIPSDNKVNVVVTAQNGNIQTYTLNIKFSDSINMNPSEILSNSGLKNDGKIIHTVSEGTNSNSLVTILANINSVANIIVKDVSGNQKVNANLVTGDIVSITSNSQTIDYPISVVGDINGDGKISIADLLKVQKNILGISSLSSVYLKSADVNNDSKVDLLDLLKVQKYILGVSKF